MQDDNTAGKEDGSAGANLIEPALSLGSNPSDSAQAGPAGTTPTVSDDSVPAENTDAPSNPASDTPGEDSSSAPEDDKTDDSPTVQPATTIPSGDLESIKTSALQGLAPLVSELDQEPEEKYRTLMMLIQSSDDQSLVKDAYDAAEKIEDKKAKAEALLNIINEINYFTGKVEKVED
jgi:hypothetical protein